mmetsp:Transcript_51254/g.81461  ORF Transcript_51254/g.81461 Transcript_51254/m.81461 type:complete len:689 (-) Transcript_51254:169-2235(-)
MLKTSAKHVVFLLLVSILLCTSSRLQSRRSQDQNDSQALNKAYLSAHARIETKGPSERAIDSSFETSYRCVGVDTTRSCLFQNLYYADGQFVMYVTKQPKKDEIRVHRADKYGNLWQPQIQVFPDEAAIANHVAGKDIIEEKGLSVQFDPLFHQNIGHALFDGLYPAYLATVKLDVQEHAWRPVVGVDAGCIDDSSSAKLEVGSLVEVYLPHAKYNRTLRPVRARVTRMPAPNFEDEEEDLCKWVADHDHSGMDLGSAAGKGQASCMKECINTFSCRAAVLFGGICYLKGDGGSQIPNLGRKLCILKASLNPKPTITVAPVHPEDAEQKIVSIPENWIVGKVRRRCMSEGIFETFGGAGEMRRMYELERDSRNHPNLAVRFDKIVMGIGGAGNLVADKSGAIGGSVAPNAMSQFRDRMYRAYNLDVPHGVDPLPGDRNLNVIVVENKRFSSVDRKHLNEVIEKLNNKGQVHAEFIDWGRIGQSESKFLDHLKKVREADIYISSIGTALQYVPFLRDRKVYIALGSVWKRSGRYFPTFMEQQLAGGGTPHLRTLYADPGEVLRRNSSSLALGEDGYFVGVDGGLVWKLAEEAEKLVRQGFNIPVPIEDNLSVEGKVLVELCRRDAVACTELIEYRNFREYECECLLWNEAVVYEVGPWREGGKCGDSYRKLLRQLRKEYGLPAYGAPQI